jgi:hypothetical protein
MVQEMGFTVDPRQFPMRDANDTSHPQAGDLSWAALPEQPISGYTWFRWKSLILAVTP